MWQLSYLLVSDFGCQDSSLPVGGGWGVDEGGWEEALGAGRRSSGRVSLPSSHLHMDLS